MIVLDSVNKEEAMRYMGLGDAEPSESIREIIAKSEEELLRVIHPLYTYAIFDINVSNEYIELANTSVRLTGNAVREHLKGCSGALLLAATLGIGADKFIKRKQISDLTSALAADALASAAVEQVCNIAETEIAASIKPFYMTWRFSPGYGDLPLSLQPSFLSALNAQKRIGLTVTDSLIMLPSKSVTAVIGISDKPIEKKRQGCAVCNMRHKCQFRKRGERCVGY